MAGPQPAVDIRRPLTPGAQRCEQCGASLLSATTGVDRLESRGTCEPPLVARPTDLGGNQSYLAVPQPQGADAASQADLWGLESRLSQQNLFLAHTVLQALLWPGLRGLAHGPPQGSQTIGGLRAPPGLGDPAVGCVMPRAAEMQHDRRPDADGGAVRTSRTKSAKNRRRRLYQHGRRAMRPDDGTGPA